METNEKKVEIAAKLYKCRRSCMMLFGDTWKEKINIHTELIKAEMQKIKTDNEIEAAITLIDYYGNKYPENKEAFTIKILAAAIELIEPLK